MAKGKTGGTNPPPEGQNSRFQAEARAYAEKALAMLFDLAGGAESEAVRVSAIKELLDRGFGKSGATANADPGEPMPNRIERVIVDPQN